MSEEDNELNLEEVVEVEPGELSEDQKTFLEENKGDLTDEQAEKFGIEREEEEEEEEPRTRATPPVKTKKEDDEEIDPDDEERINKVVDKRMERAGMGETRDQLQVDAVIRDKPELASYRARALKYMKVHPTLVAQDAVAIVSNKDAQAIGAKKEREAAEKVNKTKSPGGTVRKVSGGGVDWSKATKEEVDAKRDEVMGRA